MKCYINNYKNTDDLFDNLDLSTLEKCNTLIQVFSGLTDEQDILRIQSAFKLKNPALSYIGATTAGEIHDGETSEYGIVVSIVVFEHTNVEYTSVTNGSDYGMGIALARNLFKDNTKAMLLFTDGLRSNASDVIDGISSVNTSIPLAGGLAGDNGNFRATYVFDKNGIYEKGAVAASLSSDRLNVFTDYQLNWQPIGQFMTVTKAEKNRLYEIDGICASEVYREYLGERVGANLPFSATEFPLLKIKDDGLEICRTFTHKFDDGSLLTIGNMEIGDRVRFAFGNVDLVLNNTKHNISRYRGFHPEVIFAYSCTARKSFLQSEIASELAPLFDIAPMCGFFTYGEIFHDNARNSLLNITLTIFALSENIEEFLEPADNDEAAQINSEKNFIANKHFLILDALTNLSNTVIKELEEARNQLKEQANRDYLTDLYNRRYFDEIAGNMIRTAGREKKPISVMMIDVDHFKEINDTHGHLTGDAVIRNLAHLLKELTRKSDIAARFGGEEFAVLLPFTDKEGARKIAEALRAIIETYQVVIDDSNPIRFTISIGIAEVNHEQDKHISSAIDRADAALYRAKKSGRNRVIVCELQ